MRTRRLPYRVIGAYDSETTNYSELGIKTAFPILHQVGVLDSTPLADITPDNVESHVGIRLFRHAFELYAFLDNILDEEYDYVPVICCHNLAFDMYSLADWLNSKDVKVLAKSARKPITFTVLNGNGNPALVFWDTLVFSQKPLSMMGHECGYEKAVGEWDYSLIRTNETPLSADEVDYACKDIYALIAWLGYWLRMNPDIDASMLGLNVVTKTGVIRQKRKLYFDQVKGRGLTYNAGRFQNYVTRTEAPKSDDELFTMQAVTRGGFTFCASKWAGIPIVPDSGYKVVGFDATSQHPAQMVGRFCPHTFKRVSAESLDIAFDIVSSKSVRHLLDHPDKPFPVAFNACFEFENLRPKAGSVLAENGILPLASARFACPIAIDDENESLQNFREYAFENGYRDVASNPVFLFGKLVSADYACLWITELAAWEIAQCYDFDSVKAISGYLTMKFMRPTDYSLLSVMQFYDAKNIFKKAMHEYKDKRTVSASIKDELLRVKIPLPIVEDMVAGTLPDDDLEFIYLGLKADLNGLFGIEATNEYRQDTILSPAGISYTGAHGICNAPKNPKAWYQFGQRIVGWSRIAQIIVMQLAAPHVEGIVNGDTDSIKFLVKRDYDPADLEDVLSVYSRSIDKGKNVTCRRLEYAYPDRFSRLEGIGHYVFEFEAAYFCASWNKSYIVSDGDSCEFTLAGIPSKNSRRDIDLNRAAGYLMRNGSFESVCNSLLGYNITICHDITGLNLRTFPEWGSYVSLDVTDYLGSKAHVVEPAALALFPLDKLLNNTGIAENRANCLCAIGNNGDIERDARILHLDGNGNPHITYLKEFRR